MLTVRQHDLLTYIDQHVSETGVVPSFDEMKAAMALRSKSGIHRMVRALEERGFIRRLPNRARAMEVVRAPPQRHGPRMGSGTIVELNQRPAERHSLVTIGDRGFLRATATQSEIALRNTHFEVPYDLAPQPEDFFALVIRGDYLVEAGIIDGDRVVMQRTDRLTSGDIMLCLVDGEDVMLRRVRARGSSVALECANASYETRIYPLYRVEALARVVSLIRSYGAPA